MFTVARVSSVVAVSTALICAVALPATAADPAPANTTLTVTVPQGGLQISAPTSAAFGTVTSGIAATKTATLTDVTVTDTRAGLVNQWVASVSSSNFVGTNAGNSFTAEAVTYLSGVAAADAGTLAGGSLAVAAPGGAFKLKNTSQTAQSATGILGNNTAKWSPLLTLTVPDNAPADTYTATLTHSVV